MTTPKELSSWLAIAELILEGEYDGCDDSLRKSITIGLRSINHDKCRQAITELEADAEARKRKVRA